ncbi:hypothetical protein OXYTRIMIC_205 [Oxytricha trifallax]|uniref:Uncharacterized protein n=1 Tax=Oxytricha trifallax TaxID=1172189 RepID=A0A073I0S4_9SPIT|nr:hypothetical protein OXYTRIMIC_205 [Oxytricha trifallax]
MINEHQFQYQQNFQSQQHQQFQPFSYNNQNYQSTNDTRFSDINSQELEFKKQQTQQQSLNNRNSNLSDISVRDSFQFKDENPVNFPQQSQSFHAVQQSKNNLPVILNEISKIKILDQKPHSTKKEVNSPIVVKERKASKTPNKYQQISSSQQTNSFVKKFTGSKNKKQNLIEGKRTSSSQNDLILQNSNQVRKRGRPKKLSEKSEKVSPVPRAYQNQQQLQNKVETQLLKVEVEAPKIDLDKQIDKMIENQQTDLILNFDKQTSFKSEVQADLISENVKPNKIKLEKVLLDQDTEIEEGQIVTDETQNQSQNQESNQDNILIFETVNIQDQNTIDVKSNHVQEYNESLSNSQLNLNFLINPVKAIQVQIQSNSTVSKENSFEQIESNVQVKNSELYEVQDKISEKNFNSHLKFLQKFQEFIKALPKQKSKRYVKKAINHIKKKEKELKQTFQFIYSQKIDESEEEIKALFRQMKIIKDIALDLQERNTQYKFLKELELLCQRIELKYKNYLNNQILGINNFKALKDKFEKNQKLNPRSILLQAANNLEKQDCQIIRSNSKSKQTQNPNKKQAEGLKHTKKIVKDQISPKVDEKILSKRSKRRRELKIADIERKSTNSKQIKDQKSKQQDCKIENTEKQKSNLSDSLPAHEKQNSKKKQAVVLKKDEQIQNSYEEISEKCFNEVTNKIKAEAQILTQESSQISSKRESKRKHKQNIKQGKQSKQKESKLSMDEESQITDCKKQEGKIVNLRHIFALNYTTQSIDGNGTIIEKSELIEHYSLQFDGPNQNLLSKIIKYFKSLKNKE